MKRLVGCVLIIGAVLLPWMGFASEGSIAVPDFEFFGVDKQTAKAVSGVFRSEVQAVSKRPVISYGDVKGLLNMMNLRQMVGCVGNECFSEIGDLLGATELIAGAISSVGGKFVLSARRIDTKHGKVLARASITAATVTDLTDKAKVLAQKLFEVPARLKLSGQIEGAEVYLDNKLIGKLPQDEFLLLEDDGEHELRVEHPEYVPYSTKVYLKRGKTAVVHLDLKSVKEIEDVRNLRKWWGWGLIGSAVAFGALSGVMFWQGQEAYDDYNSLDRRRDPVSLFDTYRTRTKTFYALGYTSTGISAALLGVGLYLLLYDPYADMLKQAGFQSGKAE